MMGKGLRFACVVLKTDHWVIATAAPTYLFDACNGALRGLGIEQKSVGGQYALRADINIIKGIASQHQHDEHGNPAPSVVLFLRIGDGGIAKFGFNGGSSRHFYKR